MGELKRAPSPFRFSIPKDLYLRLRAQNAQQSDWGEPIDSEDVVHLSHGLGPALFLTFDGRVLVDMRAWDGPDAEVYEVTDPKEARQAIIIGAKNWDFPHLLRLLPPRPANARDCPVCRGTGRVSWVDTEGKPGSVLCWQRCGGLGWLAE